MSDVLVTKLKQWREDPICFVRENFGVIPDRWQEKALNAFKSRDVKKMRISLQACAGPGKSAVLAWCGWNFLLCYGERGEHPKGACVSITQENLKDNLWVEFAKWQKKSEILSQLFTWQRTKIFSNENPETWFLSARSFPRSADPDTIGATLSGLHSKYVLFLIDESGAIPPQIAKAAEQAMGEILERDGGFGKVMQAGNPLSRDGMLYQASKDPGWFKIRITGDPEDPDRSPRINMAWAQEQIDKYGRDDPWVASYILGKFPEGGVDSLLTDEEVDLAMNRHYDISDYGHSQKRMGIDVARNGADSSVMFPRQGLVAFRYKEMRGLKGNEVAARVLISKEKWGSELELVDSTGGFGSSVIDSLDMAGFPPFEVNYSAKASVPSRFVNLRAEMWFKMAQWIKKGGALPKCATLKKELTEIKYFLNKGRLQLEAKDQLKSRLGFSPDKADALAQTFAVPDMAATHEFEYAERYYANKRDKDDYDPTDHR